MSYRSFSFSGVACFLAVLAFPVCAATATSNTGAPSNICRNDETGRSQEIPGMKDCVYKNLASLNSFSILRDGGRAITYDGGLYFQASRLHIEDYDSVVKRKNLPGRDRWIYDFLSSAYWGLPTGETTTPYVVSPNYATDRYFMAGYSGVRLNALPSAAAKSNVPIDAHGVCRYVDNRFRGDYFVPLQKREEWLSFVNNPPPGVSLVKCALPCDGGINGKCDGSASLMFGPTSARFDLAFYSDRGVNEVSKGAKFFVPQLPYRRVENEAVPSPWPSTGASTALTQMNFKYECTQVYSEPKCFDKTPQYCPYTHTYNPLSPLSAPCVLDELSGTQACSTPDGMGGWTTVTYSKVCCAKMGSVCRFVTHQWTELWRLNQLVSKASTDISDRDYAAYTEGRVQRSTGWSSSISTRIGGSTRPAECTGYDLYQYSFPTEEIERCLTISQCEALPGPVLYPLSGGASCSAPKEYWEALWQEVVAKNNGSSAGCYLINEFGQYVCP